MARRGVEVLRVALLQMDAGGADVEANAETAEAHCRRAKELDADIALMPEMFSVGYRFPRDLGVSVEEWARLAQPADGPFVRRFAGLARELEMAIAVTYLEGSPNAPQPRNVVTLLDRRGASALTYAKVHLCAFDAEIDLAPGDGFRVAELDTRVGPVRVGAMICYDREFPETARILMLEGAELILVPNACEMERHRTAQLQARASENMVAIALANSPRDGGLSMAVDGVAFVDGASEGSSRDMVLVEAGPSGGVHVAEIDLDLLRSYRATETWGNAYRRPRLYGKLLDEAVEPPFVRPDARR